MNSINEKNECIICFEVFKGNSHKFVLECCGKKNNYKKICSKCLLSKNFNLKWCQCSCCAGDTNDYSYSASFSCPLCKKQNKFSLVKLSRYLKLNFNYLESLLFLVKLINNENIEY